MVKESWCHGKAGVVCLVRGLPGSGKSTFAHKLTDGSDFVLETDSYFCMEPDGEYRWDGELLYRAHKWCFNTYRVFLNQGYNVIVANCNLKFKDCKEYVDFAKRKKFSIGVFTMLEQYGSIHDVPDFRMERNAQKMESHETFMEKLIAYQPD